jgi:hypothetical protein
MIGGGIKWTCPGDGKNMDDSMASVRTLYLPRGPTWDQVTRNKTVEAQSFSGTGQISHRHLFYIAAAYGTASRAENVVPVGNGCFHDHGSWMFLSRETTGMAIDIAVP